MIFEFEKNFTVQDLQSGIVDKIRGLDVSILFNNACFSEGNEFEKISLDSVHAMMAFNCYSITLMSKLMLESFKKRN